MVESPALLLLPPLLLLLFVFVCACVLCIALLLLRHHVASVEPIPASPFRSSGPSLFAAPHRALLVSLFRARV